MNSDVGLTPIHDHQATGEVAEIYDDVRTTLQAPTVPNFMKIMAASPGALLAEWVLMKTMIERLTLPSAIISMIQFAVAQQNECEYCSANHELNCRMLGIDEAILEQVVRDLGNVSPERVRAIIEFALKAAKHPKDLSRVDYDRVREYGITNAEIVEIVFIAAIACAGDILADALKVSVEDSTTAALAQ